MHGRGLEAAELPRVAVEPETAVEAELISKLKAHRIVSHFAQSCLWQTRVRGRGATAQQSAD